VPAEQTQRAEATGEERKSSRKRYGRDWGPNLNREGLIPGAGAPRPFIGVAECQAKSGEGRAPKRRRARAQPD
jgi:hypothetical protein